MIIMKSIKNIKLVYSEIFVGGGVPNSPLIGFSFDVNYRIVI